MGIVRYLRRKLWRRAKVTAHPNEGLIFFDADLVEKLGGVESCLGKHVIMVSLRPATKHYAFVLADDTDETRMLDKKVRVFEGGRIGFVSTDVDVARIIADAGYVTDGEKPQRLTVIRRKTPVTGTEFYELM